MNKLIVLWGGAAMIAALLPACQEPECGCLEPVTESTFTFNSGAEGWKSGFADYPVGEDEFYELDANVSNLPAPLDETEKGLMISGNNHSDDLFMFIAHPFTGLAPKATYQVLIEVEVASNAPQNSVGIGGSPGSSVYLKAGAYTAEPKAIQEGEHWVMNLDKGNQSQGGAHMQVLGTIGTDLEEFTYAKVDLDNRNQPFSVQTNERGELWVIIGTDSGFEGTTTLYYDRIRVKFLP